MATTQQLTVTATLDGGGDPVDVTASATYVSADETKATVNSSGLITAVAEGSTTVTASYGGKTATCNVSVAA